MLLSIFLFTKTILTTALSLAKRAWEWTGTIPFLRYLLLGVLIGAVTVGYWNCGSPKPVVINPSIEANTAVSTEEVNRATVKVGEAEKTSQEASKRTETARKEANRARVANTKNTDYSKANAERCLTYPESEECR